MIAEFSDFQCPFCKRWTESSLGAVRKRLGDDVAIAFLHFPITQIHPNAGNASVVAICAGQQGKFWEMHDLLFARQAEWSNLR
jgi:protein-disulfide isomerase